MSGRYHDDPECCRCKSKARLQYDNDLCGYMCSKCWEAFFKSHESCAGCGTQGMVLLPEKEELWITKDVENIACMSSNIGARLKGEPVCEECTENMDEWKDMA
jgi:hypothetical protein